MLSDVVGSPGVESPVGLLKTTGNKRKCVRESRTRCL